MRRANDPHEEDVSGAQLVSSDLFFGLAAILLVVLALMSTKVQEIASAALDSMNVAPIQKEDPIADWASASGDFVALATVDGVTLFAPSLPEAVLGLDSIFGAPQLEQWVGQAMQSDIAPLLVITPDSGDSAFLAEPALAGAGLVQIRRVRLPAGCEDLIGTDDGLACTDGK